MTNAPQCLAIARHGRQLRDLHRLAYNRDLYAEGGRHTKAKLDAIASAATLEGLGGKSITGDSDARYRTDYYWTLPVGFWERTSTEIATIQSEADDMVRRLYME